MRFITGLVFLFLFLPRQADAQPGALFNGDSAIYRQHHVRACHAHNGDSATKGGNVQTFDRAGRLLVDARLNGNDDTLDVSRYFYDDKGRLSGDSSRTNGRTLRVTTYCYDTTGKQVLAVTELIPKRKKTTTRTTYTPDGRPDSIIIFTRGEIGSAYVVYEDGSHHCEPIPGTKQDTICFSYAGDTVRTWYSFMSAEREYMVNDSAGRKLVVMKSLYGEVFYPYETFTCDAAGRPVRLERRLSDGKLYMWETYRYDEKGLLIRMEYFQANISTEKPTAVLVYSYTFY